MFIQVLPIQSNGALQTEVNRGYWPTEEWQIMTPESQGMSLELLNDMLTTIEDQGIYIDSIVIIRNGYLVLEEFPRGVYDSEDRHIIHSCTKSFTSALVGIAIAEGYIDGLDSKLIDLLPNHTITNLDERKQAITLEHLLTMTSGLEWDEWTEPYDSPLNSHYQMWSANDSIQYILDQPMSSDPGTTWTYSSGDTNLLGAIVSEVTGESLFDYAVEKLLTPIGISSSDVFWPRDDQGRYWASGGVEMLPRDMAKFGYLYLNNGSWDGEQIVPAGWVQDSSTTHCTFDDFNGYSYQWWTYTSNRAHVFAAQGFAGQYIYIVPSLDMVVVFTSSVPPYEAQPHTMLLFDYIIPAAINEISKQTLASDIVTIATLVTVFLPIPLLGVYKFQISKTHKELVNE